MVAVSPQSINYEYEYMYLRSTIHQSTVVVGLRRCLAGMALPAVYSARRLQLESHRPAFADFTIFPTLLRVQDPPPLPWPLPWPDQLRAPPDRRQGHGGSAEPLLARRTTSARHRTWRSDACSTSPKWRRQRATLAHTRRRVSAPPGWPSFAASSCEAPHRMPGEPAAERASLKGLGGMRRPVLRHSGGVTTST